MVKNITKNCSGGRAGDARPRPVRIKRSALHAIFKRLKRDKKLAQKGIKSAKHNLKSLAQQIRESTSLLAERRRGLAKERRTLVEQNARLERIENQLDLRLRLRRHQSSCNNQKDGSMMTSKHRISQYNKWLADGI
ncbi:hypothetical protein ACFE04_030904 [Oxalis oulophora]